MRARRPADPPRPCSPLGRFLVDDVSSLPPFANLGRIVNGASSAAVATRDDLPRGLTLSAPPAPRPRPAPPAPRPRPARAPPAPRPRPPRVAPPRADINDERQVHASCVDALYAPALGAERGKAISAEEKAFDAQMQGFKASFDKHKNPESFKLAWPGIEASARDFLAAVDTYHEHLRTWLPRLVDALTPEQRAALVGAMNAKRAAIAASKVQGPDAIDLRAIKKAAKLAEKQARLAAAAAAAGPGAAAAGASQKAAKKAAKKGDDLEAVVAAPAAAGAPAAKAASGAKAAKAAAKAAAGASEAPFAKTLEAPAAPSASSTPQMPVASPAKVVSGAARASARARARADQQQRLTRHLPAVPPLLPPRPPQLKPQGGSADPSVLHI